MCAPRKNRVVVSLVYRRTHTALSADRRRMKRGEERRRRTRRRWLRRWRRRETRVRTYTYATDDVVEKTEAYRWPRTLGLRGGKEGEGGGVRAEGKTTRNLCRSGTTLGRVSPCHGPHARPVSARIRGSLGLFTLFSEISSVVLGPRLRVDVG